MKGKQPDKSFGHISSIIEKNRIKSYYITGLEALKHNGFGWYFNPKIVEVINTKIERRFVLGRKKIVFIKVKSIVGTISKDKVTGFWYASNEQVFKDTLLTKNKYAASVWKQMLSRYGSLFVKNPDRYKNLRVEQGITEYSEYGV